MVVEFARVPRDTADAANRRVVEGLRRMSPAERLSMTMALCQAADQLARAGIRLREGDLSESEVGRRLGRLRLDAATFARVQAYRAGRRP
jgi:hypothetical protein